MVSADYFAWQFNKYFNYTVFYFEFLTHVNGNHIHDYLHIRLSAFADNPVFLGPGVEITRGEKR